MTHIVCGSIGISWTGVLTWAWSEGAPVGSPTMIYDTNFLVDRNRNID